MFKENSKVSHSGDKEYNTLTLCHLACHFYPRNIDS